MQQEQQKKDEPNNLIPLLGGLALLAAAVPITAKMLFDKRNKASNPIPNSTSQPVTSQGIPNTNTQPPRTYDTPDVWYETSTKVRDYTYYAPDFSQIKRLDIPPNIYQRPSTYYSKHTGYNPSLNISYADVESPFKDKVGRNIYNTVYAKGKLEGDWWTYHVESMNKWHQGNQG